MRAPSARGYKWDVRRRRPTTGLTEEMALTRLAASDHKLAVRALRRHRA
jgi:hypothetical protein